MMTVPSGESKFLSSIFKKAIYAKTSQSAMSMPRRLGINKTHRRLTKNHYLRNITTKTL